MLCHITGLPEVRQLSCEEVDRVCGNGVVGLEAMMKNLGVREKYSPDPLDFEGKEEKGLETRGLRIFVTGEREHSLQSRLRPPR
jgi:hypothetical protein